MEGLKRTAFFQYDENSNEWKSVEWWNQSVTPSTTSRVNSELRIVQFNVLYNEFTTGSVQEIIRSDIRYPYIVGTLLPETDADIYCFNEVGDTFIKNLIESDWIKTKKLYYLTAVSVFRPSDDKVSFGNLILSRFPFTKSFEYWYEKKKVSVRRPSIVVCFDDFVVTSVHLKAMRNCGYVRKMELECLYNLFGISRVVKTKASYRPPQCHEEFASCNQFVIAGDFNLCGDSEQAFIDFYDVKDVWKVVKPDEPGNTLDCDVNPLAKLVSGDEPDFMAVRYDRVLLYQKTDEWKPVSIEMIATERIDCDVDYLFPSDHFGLVVSLQKC